MNVVLSLTTERQVSSFELLQIDPSFAAVSAMRETLNWEWGTASTSVDADDWFTQTTRRIDLLRQFEDGLANDLSEASSSLRDEAEAALLLWAALAAGAGVTALALAVASAQVWRRERRLGAERRARQAESERHEAMGLMAAGTTHDLNNLLQVIMGNAALAREEQGRGSPAGDYLNAIEQAVGRAADLTQQLRDYTGDEAQPKRQMDLNAVVANSVHRMQQTFDGDSELRLDLSEHLPPVEADPRQIQEAVLSLVRNATESLGDGPGNVAVAPEPPR